MNSPDTGAPGHASSGSSSEVTVFLEALQRGDLNAAEDLLPPVYEELRKVATLKMAGERPGHTLQPYCACARSVAAAFPTGPTALEKPGALFWRGCRSHAARPRRSGTPKKSRSATAAALTHEDIALVDLPIETNPDRLLRIHEVLDELAAEEPLRAEVVKLRFFVGMDNSEIAAALAVSEKTVQRYWAYAKAWLQVALEKNE